MSEKKIAATVTFLLLMCFSLPADAAGIDVQIGSTQVIVPEQTWTTCPKGSITKFEDGDLQVLARVYIKRSSDQGQSWADGTTLFSSYSYAYAPQGVINFYGAVNATAETGVYLTTMLHSDDDGVTQSVLPATVVLPDSWTGVIAASHSRIIELSDGRLLTAMYGTKTGDTKSRAFALISEDWGRNWVYLSTIAHSEILTGGYNESDLLVLPDGTILCFVRAETNEAPALYLSSSTDEGQSWSTPVKIFSKGASPQAVLMSNGIIAVATGRPGNWLLFSRDGGQSWGDEVMYYSGPNPPDCMNYASLVESEPGTLLVAYARTNAVDNGLSEVAGTFVTVTRTALAEDLDFDGDSQVDLDDLSDLAAHWLNAY